MSSSPLKLHLNVDHCATVRNARGGTFPDPVDLATLAIENGVEGITAHLREDRRHIKDEDMFRLRRAVRSCLNMEMAATDEMIKIATMLKPDQCCLVPEKRQELTTEGGLNVAGDEENYRAAVDRLHEAGIAVSLFIEPSSEQVEASARVGADFIELHTGAYAEAFLNPDLVPRQKEIERLHAAAELAVSMNLRVNAGHGLTAENVPLVKTLAGLEELNIGFYLIGRMLFVGVIEAITEMRAAMCLA